MLLGLEHNYSSAIHDPTPQVSNPAVRRAIDIINAEETADLTVMDVARELGISLRALEIGFRKQTDVSPSSYLRRVRLHRAHAELLVSDGTVGQIAMNWGFAHAGPFSRAYRDGIRGVTLRNPAAHAALSLFPARPRGNEVRSDPAVRLVCRPLNWGLGPEDALRLLRSDAHPTVKLIMSRVR